MSIHNYSMSKFGLFFLAAISPVILLKAAPHASPSTEGREISGLRSGKEKRWERNEAEEREVKEEIKTLLGKPLNLNTAVRIAFLNNRALQATFEEIGLSEAEVKEAGTIPNPSFDLSFRFPDKPPSGTDVEYGAAIDILRLLMIPLKKKIAKEQLEQTTLRVADETLVLLAQVKAVFYRAQAAQQMLGKLKMTVEACAAAMELGQRQHEAGNITDLALAEQLTTYSQARVEVARMESDLRHERENLNRLLGLWGTQTDWKLAGSLPNLPPSDPPESGLERLAISQRLDLQAQYLKVQELARARGLTKDFRFLGALQFGMDSERSSDSQTITGPTFAIELPIFNQGQPRIARSEAALRQQERKLEDLAIEIRSKVRELRDELSSKRSLAAFYLNELLPNQRQTLSLTMLNYNAMLSPPGELFRARIEMDQLERDYLGALRDYWITKAELERSVGGSLGQRLIHENRGMGQQRENKRSEPRSEP